MVGFSCIYKTLTDHIYSIDSRKFLMSSPLHESNWRELIAPFIHEEESADISSLESKKVKVLWKCETCGSPFLTSCYERFREGGRRNCTTCIKKISSQKQKETKLKKSGNLADTFPDIAKDWDYSLNQASGMTPQTVGASSSSPFWWKCENGHSISTKVYRRVSYGCSTCNAKSSQDDQRIEIWDSSPSWIELLHPLSAEQVANKVPIQRTLFTWSCEKCGDPFTCTVADRTREGSRRRTLCSKCGTEIRGARNSKTRLERSGSIGDLFPEIAAEWAVDLNQGVSVFEVTPAKNRSYWWRCKYGHEWKARTSNRTYLGRNCPKCNDPSTSLLEMRIFAELSEIEGYILLRTKVEGFEADLYIPSLRIAIESDGYPWHSGVKKEARDLRKNQVWESVDIDVIRIRDSKLKPLGTHIIQFQEKGDSNHFEILHELVELLLTLRPNEKFIQELNNFYKENETFRNQNVYLELISQRVAKEENRLSVSNPELLDEWDYEKNAPLTPDRVSRASPLKVSWICSTCSNEWEARIANRTQLGRGCPVCAKKRVQAKREAQFISGGNTLKEKYPEIALEYNDAKNELDSSHIAPKSTRSVWWICKKCGNEWKTTVANRTRLSSGCPNYRNHSQ